MTEQEALSIVAMIEDTWHFTLEKGGRNVWVGAFLPYDAPTAVRAVGVLATREHYKPMPSDVIAVIRKLNADDREQRRPLPEPPRSAIPEWVLVWRWARFGREQTVLTPFPQQHPHHQPPYLTQHEYEVLRHEWVEAGQPGRGLTAEQVVAT